MYDNITITVSQSDDEFDLGDFGALFIGLEELFKSFIKEKHPKISGKAKLGIREMRNGSIIIELAAIISPYVIDLTAEILMQNFKVFLKDRYDTIFQGRELVNEKKSDLTSICKVLQPVAGYPNARIEFTGFETEDSTEIHFSIDTNQANQIVESANERISSYNTLQEVIHQNVLMEFRRVDVGQSRIGKRSGEYVLIKQIFETPLPLIYQQRKSEQDIKNEIRGSENVFSRGFIVDIILKSRSGRPLEYVVTNLNRVIDLPKNNIEE